MREPEATYRARAPLTAARSRTEEPQRTFEARRTNSASYRASDCWLTPIDIIEALAPFDLDPCAMVDQPWPTAKRHLTIHDDGLAGPWRGRVWLNPPYSDPRPWLARLADHGDGIALVNAATGTRWFHDYIWDRADAVLFLKSRLHFCRPDGTPSGPNPNSSCLVAYGSANVARVRRYAPPQGGRFIDLRMQRGMGTERERGGTYKKASPRQPTVRSSRRDAVTPVSAISRRIDACS